jgi:(S)-ureidoglycine aminohydrolase
MHHLGHTRSSYRPDHLLQTPDTFVRAPLPGMTNATAIVHAAPAMGAAFIEYTVEFEADGCFDPGKDQCFVYVLDGEVLAAWEKMERRLTVGQYAYLAPESGARLSADKGTRAVVIEKPLRVLNGQMPGHLAGDAASIVATAMESDEAVKVRTLIPADLSFDFAVNTMTFQPGATLPRVEIHEMEHGLLMLEGEGIYRLGDCWYPVKAGDFIWMSPYCPQWFGALGKKPAKYLIYKNWNRHPLLSR